MLGEELTTSLMGSWIQGDRSPGLVSGLGRGVLHQASGPASQSCIPAMSLQGWHGRGNLGDILCVLTGSLVSPSLRSSVGVLDVGLLTGGRLGACRPRCSGLFRVPPLLGQGEECLVESFP